MDESTDEPFLDRSRDRSRSVATNESKIDDEFQLQFDQLELGNVNNNVNAKIQRPSRASRLAAGVKANVTELSGKGTLRRRFNRRRAAPPDDDRDETKSDDNYSPRDKPTTQESKEDEVDQTPTTKPESIKKSVMNTKQAQHHQPMPMMHHSSNYIRKPTDEKLSKKLRGNLRSVADGIPEVHFIGEITEGVGFKDTFVSCKCMLEWGRSWSFLAGEDSTQTQYSASDDDGVQIWNHPIDVHFATANMKGWPRIIVQVWELDEYGRSILSGYGFAHLPTNPGQHEIEIRCWRPSGSMLDELQSLFLGTSSCLVDEKVIFGKAWESRSQLVTVSCGIVKMEVNVMVRFAAS